MREPSDAAGPAATPPGPDSAAAGSPATAGCRGRILHVDDDPISSAALGEWLRLNRYAVAHAAGPTEAEPLLRDGRFDVIISDIHMPGNRRLEWVETLLKGGCGTPILLLTGNPELETACRAANLPVAGYVIKPPAWAALDDRLQQIIAVGTRRREILQLSRQVLEALQRHPGSEDDLSLIRQLAELTRAADRAETRPGRPDDDVRWRAAIADCITVIGQTKHSFHSRELGRLKARLQEMLGARPGG